MKWLYASLCVLFIQGCQPAQAQFFGQGPWNQFAQPQASQKVYRGKRVRYVRVRHYQRVRHVRRARVVGGAPHPDLRCGYWLMQKFGKTDRSLWRAYAWSGVGRPSNGSVGDVAVMKRSHVGYVSGHCSGGGIQLTSYGNSRIGVFTKCYPRSAFKAFRRV